MNPRIPRLPRPASQPNRSLVPANRPQHRPGGPLPTRPPSSLRQAPALHRFFQRGHTMHYWDPGTGAPSQEMMDIAELWFAEGRPVETIDEEHIRTLAPHALVVELGPGLGGDLRALSKALPAGQIVAVEQCPLVLARLGAWFAAHSNLRFVQGTDLASAKLSPGLVDYVRLVRVAPYFSEAELGRCLAQGEVLLNPQGRLLVTLFHPGKDPCADPATGQGFGHHSLATVLRVVHWHCRLRLDRLVLSIKDRRTRAPLQHATLNLDNSHPEALDQTVLALVAEHGDSDVEIEMRLWFARHDAPPQPEPGQPEM